MATPAVQAASCAGASTVVITTTVIVVPTAVEEPAWTAFAAEPSDANSTGKIGKDFWPFLMDTSKNEEWWKWSYEQQLIVAENKNVSFAKVDKHFDSSVSSVTAESKSLNQLCHYFLKDKNTTDITGDEATKAALAKAFWKYCSPLGKEPVTLAKSTLKPEYKSKIGETKKADVISTDGNDRFWFQKNQWFQSQSSITDTFFNSFKSKNKTLKEACEKAYSSTKPTNGSSTETSPTEDAVGKYCGFKIQTT